MLQRHSWLVVVALGCVAVHHSASAADYSAMNGQQLFGRFCSACHGAAAHGDGPVASSFQIQVPDLTLLAQRHGSRFSVELIEKIIDGRQPIAAHAERNMPAWGEEFTRAEMGQSEAEQATRIAIKKIADYLVSIQRESTLARPPKK